MPLSRGAGPSLLAALAQPAFHPVLLTYADWPGGAIREHTGRGTITWDGQTWAPGSRFTGWEAPEEEAALAASDATVHYVGTLEETVAALAPAIRGRSIRVWWGCTTTAGGSTLVGEPVLHLAGTFSSRTFRLQRQGPTDFAHDLSLGVTLGPWARAAATLSHSYESQKAAYPTDTAGRHLQNLAKKRANPPEWPER